MIEAYARVCTTMFFPSVLATNAAYGSKDHGAAGRTNKIQLKIRRVACCRHMF